MPRCFYGTAFASDAILLQHVKKYGHQFQCKAKHCNRFFKDVERLRSHQHVSKHAGAVSHSLTATWEDKEALRKSATRLLPYCAECYRVFDTDRAFTQHKQSTGHKQDGAQTLSTCSVCCKKLRTLMGLSDHCRMTGHENATQGPAGQAMISHSDQGTGDRSTLKTKPCTLCGRKFKDLASVRDHERDAHFACHTCTNVYATQEKLNDHQRHSGHFYCRECLRDFATETQLLCHRRSLVHLSEHRCCDCNKRFKSEKALGDHLDSPVHNHPDSAVAPKSSTQIATLSRPTPQSTVAKDTARCVECKRDLLNYSALQQHLTSLVHKPLSNLLCPLSTGCSATFSSPSALLRHVESGRCKSGMVRAKLNDLLLKCDANRILTSESVPVVEEGGDLRSRRSANSGGGLLVDTSYAATNNEDQQLDDFAVEPPISSPASSIPSVLVDTDDTRSESSTTSGVLITPPESDDACTDWSEASLSLLRSQIMSRANGP
ncbi:hypothetical protein LTR50_001327 [Elasticomyces elasticus]|nr:hypothetical protein LTR50_001327 [Elasticomyces elasticus]